MMLLSGRIHFGVARAPSHWLSAMMMLYSWLRVARDVAAFWNNWLNGASANEKVTS
jgi:hypothetical protein